jgi:hypothetical protein
MNRNERTDENVPLFFTAGLACLICLPIIYLVTRPVVWWIRAPWTEWLLAPLFTLIPLSVVFIILYFSAWHREWTRATRILSTALSSCVIFGVDLLLIVLMTIVGCIVVGLARVMGGN